MSTCSKRREREREREREENQILQDKKDLNVLLHRQIEGN